MDAFHEMKVASVWHDSSNGVIIAGTCMATAAKSVNDC